MRAGQTLYSMKSVTETLKYSSKHSVSKNNERQRAKHCLKKSTRLLTGSWEMQKHAHGTTAIRLASLESHLLCWDRSGKSTTFLFLSFGLLITKEMKSGLKCTMITDSTRLVKWLLGPHR